jgi:stearoyl-CoA desaturase (delta-9 desaturase)
MINGLFDLPGFRQDLKLLWAYSAGHCEARVEAWCRQAEDTGIAALGDFARLLRGYARQTA